MYPHSARGFAAVTVLAALTLTGCSSQPPAPPSTAAAPSESPAPAPSGSPTPGPSVSAPPLPVPRPDPAETTLPGPTSAPPQFKATPAPAPSDGGELYVAELSDDIDTAVDIVDTFWHDHWSEYFPGTYAAPEVIGLYDGNDEATAPRCGDDVLGAGNAFYCAVNDTVQWDAQLMAEGYADGDSWVYLVVAHEWGHAIQHRVPSIEMNADELQADCFAGAALFGAARDGNLILEDGDLREIASGLSALSDEVEWADSDSHGDPFERIEWFNRGRTDGVEACFATD
jgi:predicted metalloprotease